MSDKPYKMLIIGLSRNRGGVESYILNMLRSFTLGKLQCYFPMNGAEQTFGEELTAMGHHFFKVPAGRGRHFIRYYREWNRIFSECHFDAVYLNDCSIVQIDLLRIAKQHHVPVRIFHAHNSSWMGKGPTLYHRFMAAWNKSHITSIATKLLSCSRESAKWMFPRGSAYEIVHNAIDVQANAYSEIARVHIRDEFALKDVPLIGYIGRFDLEKNPEYFVRTFAELRQKLPEAVAFMVGDGALRADVESAIRVVGLPSKSIHLLGVRRDVSDIMSALDCLVMPSLVEGFPYVLVEAQAHGLPCVVSDRVPTDTNVTGLLQFVSLDHSSDWVHAINKALCQNEDRSMYAEKLREKGFDSRSVFATLEEDIIKGIESTRS